MPQYPFIALEVHDASLWEPSRILPLIEPMERWGYNVLVLHQNDLLDVCTQLGLTANYGVSDLRLKKVRHATAWLTRLVERLARIDAQLFLEIKEPSFHDYVLELFPDLMGPDGAPDLASESWAEFCGAKVQDLLTRVPGLGGLIVNLSSPESRVSMPDHVAVRDPALASNTWFDRMIAAFHVPLAQHHKDLWVRDFSYTADVQSDVLSAINRCNGAVGASVKVTAHDYFPEFPENPGAAMVEGPLIIEFDGFGEHTGWGVIPNCRVAEFRRRAEGMRALGAKGCMMRISWEAINGANALDGLSGVNVFALPRLFEADCDPEDLVLDWLCESFDIGDGTAGKAAALLLDSWHIPAAAYWNGLVFPRHSCLPSTWQEGWQSMETSGMGRRDRILDIGPDHPLLTEKARAALFDAKAHAVALAESLAMRARELRSDLPDDLSDLFRCFDLLPLFARQFDLAMRATFFAARGGKDDLVKLADLKANLTALAEEMARHPALAGDVPHHHRVLFDPEQVRRFTASLPHPATH